MAVNITITGENAAEALADLQTLAKAMLNESTKTSVEWKFVPTGASPTESDVRMAASVPEDTGLPAEDKPARKRRTKAEIEAARRAGETPQEGEPELDFQDTEPMIEEVVADILDEDVVEEPAAHVPTREETRELMVSIMNSKLRSPLELKTLLRGIGGETCTNLATIADPFIPEIHARFTAILADVSK
jgi:hypothetical protein